MAKKTNASWYAWLGLVFSSVVVALTVYPLAEPFMASRAENPTEIVVGIAAAALLILQGSGAMFLMMGMSFPPTNRPWIVDTENLDRAVFFYGLFAFAAPVIMLAFFPNKEKR